ncbi:MAG: hypothetical protein JW895_08765 [Thermoleophilaceae bacterium]|nr:hypothetical protein [Thermoleophilaceae bacterium]
MDSTGKLAVALASARGLYGVALAVAPGRLGTSWLGVAAAAPPVHVALRGLAVRDLALCAGAADAAVRGRPLRPWLLASAGCDVADIAATLAAGDAVPSRSRAGTIALAGISAAAAAALATIGER